MKLGDQQFNLVLQIANSVTAHAAKRPENDDTFQSFAEAIIDVVCKRNV